MATNGYEEYDLREQQEKFRENERKARLRTKRWEAIATIGVALAVAAVLIAGLYFWYAYASGPEVPSPEEKHMQELEQVCVDKGGIWLDPAGASNKPVCVFSEKGAVK